MTPSDMELDTKQFAHWIKGYQSFYEPVVRVWFEENGYQNPQPMSVSGVDLAHAADSLEADRPRGSLSAEARTSYANTLRRRSKLRGGRVQLDMVAEKRGLSVGEFKSWGGYMGPATWKLVRYEFVGDTLGLFMTLTQIKGQEVKEAILVLPQRSDEHETVESNLSELYGLPVKLFYLQEIFADLGPSASALRDLHLRSLDDAVQLVHQMTGGVPTPRRS